MAGRCRWVTAPATSTRVPSGTASSSVGGDHAERVEVLAQELGRIAVRRDAGGPHVGGGQLQLAHPGQRGMCDDDPTPGSRSGRSVAAAPGRPQPFAAGDPEAAERPRGGQRLGLRHGQLHPPGQVQQGGERPVGLAFVDDPLGQSSPMWRTLPSPSRTSSPSFSSVACARLALTSGPCTVTPCRRASATSDCGE